MQTFAKPRPAILRRAWDRYLKRRYAPNLSIVKKSAFCPDQRVLRIVDLPGQVSLSQLLTALSDVYISQFSFQAGRLLTWNEWGSAAISDRECLPNNISCVVNYVAGCMQNVQQEVRSQHACRWYVSCHVPGNRAGWVRNMRSLKLEAS